MTRGLKKAFAAALTGCICLLSGCTADTASDQSSSASSGIGTTAQSAAADLPDLPDYEVNIPENNTLAYVTINGLTLDISYMSLEEFISFTGLTEITGTSYAASNGFVFSGVLFSRPDSSESSVAVEIADSSGNVVDPKDIAGSCYSDYRIIAVRVNDFITKYDLSVDFSGGIRLGMKIDDCIAEMGLTTVDAQDIAYNNGVQTMIILGENSVDEIYLFNNF